MWPARGLAPRSALGVRTGTAVTWLWVRDRCDPWMMAEGGGEAWGPAGRLRASGVLGSICECPPAPQAQGLVGATAATEGHLPSPAHRPAPSPGSWAGGLSAGPICRWNLRRALAGEFGPFMWSAPNLVFHRNGQGLVSCLSDNWWFLSKR